jgi:hypothetical protein
MRRKRPLNSVKLFTFAFVFTVRLWAEAVSFSVAAPQLPVEPGKEAAESQAEILAQLKVQAVSEWLQGYLGNRYSQFERAVTVEFAEKHVIDYSVSRTSTNPPNVVLNGHLDTDGLKRWLRLAETKNKGGSHQLRAIAFLSSNIPGISFSASDTAQKAREITIASQIHTLLQPLFQKLNAKLTLADGGAPSGNAPRTSKEVRNLKDFAKTDGTNVAVWGQLTQCAPCGGARLDLFGYSLPQERVIAAVSEDLALSQKDYTNSDYLKSKLTPIVQQFQTDFESAVTEGRVFSSEYHLIVEGVDSYRVFKNIEASLGRQDFVSQPILKRASSKTAEFIFLSSLSIEELAGRFPQVDVGGVKLRTSRLDDSTLVARLK